MTEFDDIMEDRRVIKVMGLEVVIDPKRLQFDEVTLSKYEEEEAGWCNYFGQRLADAESEMQYFELEADTVYTKKFAEFKEGGTSDKLADAKAKSDPDVIKAQEHVITARHKVKVLQQHLRAWDKSHNNSQSRGHMIRKELDKLNRDLYIKQTMAEDIVGDKDADG